MIARLQHLIYLLGRDVDDLEAALTLAERAAAGLDEYKGVFKRRLEAA